jgi:hypothetical protein
MKNSTHRLLKEIAKRNGMKVRRGKRFQIFFFSQLIEVDDKVGPNVWTWNMLHEMGHAELAGRRERCHINTIVRMVKMGIKGYRPTEAFYRDYIDMEWKAWEQGFRIAKREGIKVSESKYWIHARKCHKTYVDNLRDHYE